MKNCHYLQGKWYATSPTVNPYYQELQASGELTTEMRYGIRDAILASRDNPEYQTALSEYIAALAEDKERE